MNANAETLEKISSIIRAEFPKHLSQEFVIHDVTAQSFSCCVLSLTGPGRMTKTTCTSALSSRTTIPGSTRGS